MGSEEGGGKERVRGGWGWGGVGGGWGGVKEGGGEGEEWG